MRTVFRTSDHPPAERLDCLQELTTQIWVPVDLHVDQETDLRVELNATSLGALGILTADATPFVTRRTPRHVRQASPELYGLVLSLDGILQVRQQQHATTLGPGELVLCDTSRPFHHRAGPDGNPTKLATLVFPHALLPLHPEAVRRLLAVRLPGHGGIGGLVARFVADLARHADTGPPAAAARLATAALDLVAILLAEELEAGAGVPPESHRRALLHQVHAFIQQRLGDPGLSPDVIAAAHHISTRYLHKLFQEQGVTVAGWIRDRRLDRCRRDLADPELTARSIEAIAVRWGFGGSVQFSRAFRAAFGVSPRDYRELSRRTQDVRASLRVVR